VLARTAYDSSTDVRDKKSIQALAEEAFDTFAKVDILANNAIVYRTGTMLDVPITAWDQVDALNLRGAVVGIKTFLPGMLKRKAGVIVALTSQEGMPNAASYFASKAALQSLGLSLAAELGKESGVSAFVFAPGMVDTPGGDQAFRAMAPSFGMSYEDFTSLGTNPGYEGLMPAEDCAAGFAYTIVHAREYHGQVADPFQPLAKAGLLDRAPGSDPATGRASPSPSAVSDKAPVVGELAVEVSTVEVASELQEVLERVNRETNELDMFRRMWVTRTFRQRCGISITQWLETVTDLAPELEALGQAVETGDTAQVERIRGKLAWLVSNLERLAGYFQKNMKDAEGYFRDPEALSKALEVLIYREKTVRALTSILEQIGKASGHLTR
jgi:NAD(P)-dependent dehydrogenase (short-subunit alcohol dehydrogenase family)